MKLLLLNDLHLEFKYFFIPEMENEKETVVILAGDVGLVKKEYSYRDFINNTCDRFKNVIWVCGNHEFYGANFPTAVTKLWHATLDLENLYVVDKETVVIDDVAFVCATMWTNFDNNNVMTMEQAGYWMNDYKKIRTGPENEPWKRKLRPIDTLADHRHAVNYIFPEITKQKAAGMKVVVVTHHLPSFQSIAKELKHDQLNGAYASELFEDIMDTQPDIWHHGHSHFSMDYHIGATRIINNPRGYAPDDRNPDFNDTLTIEL